MSISFRIASSFVVLSTLFICGCGGDGMASVSGKIIENGQPLKFEMSQAAVQMTLVGPDGKLDQNKSYTAVVNADGAFEVIASGGRLPLGKYQLAIIFRGDSPKYKPFAAPDSRIYREIKAGKNHFLVDIAKPE